MQFERVSSAQKKLFSFIVLFLGFDGVEMDSKCDGVRVWL